MAIYNEYLEPHIAYKNSFSVRSLNFINFKTSRAIKQTLETIQNFVWPISTYSYFCDSWLDLQTNELAIQL